jgi:hypothetical protein
VLNNSRAAGSQGYYGYLDPPDAAKHARNRRIRRREPARRGRLPL